MNSLVIDYREMQKRLILEYMKLTYRLGGFLDSWKFKKLSSMLYQADLDMTAGMFISLTVVTATLSAVLVFLLSNMLLEALSSTSAFSLAALVGFVAFAAVVAGFMFYLINKVNVKKVEIERDLPFALAYMSILASAGSTPLKVLASLSIQNYGHISNEFKKMGYRVYFLGEDSLTAINNLANNTPSAVFRDTCFDLGNIIHSGSGLSEYLAKRSEDLITLKKLAMKEFIEDISMFAEIYLMIILFEILAIIGIPLIGLFGLEVASLNANAMFIIFAYILLPFSNILFLALLEMKYSTIP